MAVPIVFFIASATIVITFMYLYFSTRHKERMSLIESRLDAGIFNEKKRRRTGSNALKFGLFLVFIGFGFLFGFTMSEALNFDDIIIVPSILVSGGLALLLYYRIMKREEEDFESARRYSTKDDVHDVV